MPWNNGNPVQFSTPPKTPRNPKKHATGKIRTRWSNRNHRFNPIKTSRFNTMDTEVSDLNKIVMVAPTPRKACNGFGLSCSYCKQGAPHPSPQDLDWSSEDWNSVKEKRREQNKSLIDFSDPKPKMDIVQTMDIDKVPVSKLQIGQDDQKEEPWEVMESLIPPPSMTETSDNTAENTNGEELAEAERKLQREEEKYKMYNRMYVDQLSDEEDSDMNTDDTSYTYFR